jgi:hypothetical protein
MSRPFRSEDGRVSGLGIDTVKKLDTLHQHQALQ